MTADHPLPLIEIAGIERSFNFGVASLGAAHLALLRRVECGMEDADTLLRLIYLSWFSRVESTWTTGLASDVASAETWIARAGGADRLPPESQFTVGWLAVRGPDALGSQGGWSSRAAPLFRSAAEASPRSRLFAVWRWFAGERDDEQQVFLHRPLLRAEIAARFAGRGLLGFHFMRDLHASLDLAARRLTL